MIRVIDIFAGPGGLSEGFASVRDRRGGRVFDVALSVEKEHSAYKTLLLRAFYRSFDNAPDAYYAHLRGEIDSAILYSRYPREARLAAGQCWHATLGPGGEKAAPVRQRIGRAIGGDPEWVLVGGPPCQAYSIAGRSRNSGRTDYDPTKDERQTLYVEYLQILAEHRPAVFVMENVKGLLSATLSNERMFHRILDDLRNPAVAVARAGRNSTRLRKGGYRIHSLTECCTFENGDLRGAVIHAERYGVPQARHRVILLGVRDDITGVVPKSLTRREPVSASKVLSPLPRLRSGLSRRRDSARAWKECLKKQTNSRWANAGTRKVDGIELSNLIRRNLDAIAAPVADRGGCFVPGEITSRYAPQWYCDDRIGGACNHESRAHMESDLYRYMYAACYGRLHRRSPSLKDFPSDLLPDHVSVDDAIGNGGYFSDRFRVQIASKPSTTIVSHISKDGHYYIHPDPSQCRSLTVREAARLQTFPDNYHFCGNRTAQYVQVGNAVPPLLARQIGEVVLDVLERAGLCA